MVRIRDSEPIVVSASIAGKIGELVENPNQTPLPNGKIQRRVRREATEDIVKPADLQKWRVCLNHSNKIKTISTAALKIIADGVGLPQVSKSVKITIRIRSQNKLLTITFMQTG